MPKIAVDAMGGDRAPEVVVEGAMLATEELGVEVVLVGQREVVEQELTRHGAHRLEIVSASQIVEMHESPSSVLSNGEEEGKGNELTRVASELISGLPLNYVGYVEGRDIFNGRVDVVVCDGFTGNVALKTMEGAAGFAGKVLREAFQKNLASRLGYLMSRNSLREAYCRLDYAEYGGVPLIGLDGVAIIAHGGSDSRAIKNAIRAGRGAVEQDVNRHSSEILSGPEAGMGEETGGFPGKIWQRIKSKMLGDKPEREGGEGGGEE